MEFGAGWQPPKHLVHPRTTALAQALTLLIVVWSPCCVLIWTESVWVLFEMGPHRSVLCYRLYSVVCYWFATDALLQDLHSWLIHKAKSSQRVSIQLARRDSIPIRRTFNCCRVRIRDIALRWIARPTELSGCWSSWVHEGGSKFTSFVRLLESEWTRFQSWIYKQQLSGMFLCLVCIAAYDFVFGFLRLALGKGRTCTSDFGRLAKPSST